MIGLDWTIISCRSTLDCIDCMVGKGRRDMGDGRRGERKAVVFYPSTTPKKKKKWGERKVEKEGGVERGDVVFGILKPNFKVDMRIGG